MEEVEILPILEQCAAAFHGALHPVQEAHGPAGTGVVQGPDPEVVGQVVGPTQVPIADGSAAVTTRM